MSTFRLEGVVPRFRIAVLASFLAIAQILPAQNLDLTGSGTSDIWKVRYGAEGIDPELDSDGDGLINRLEALAGTDPFDPHSAPRISTFNITTNGVLVRMAGELGKRYELQGSEMICGTGSAKWLPEASLITRTDSLVILSAPARLPMRFFRVVVSDVDTDGDGLNDWEEYQLGLDPLSATSNHKLDEKGQPLDDYHYAINWLRLKAKLAFTPGAAVVQGDLILYPADANDGTGLTAEFFTNSSPTYASPVNFNPASRFLVTNTPVIDFRWGPATVPNLSNVAATVRWTGQVSPQYSEIYVFETRTDDGVKVWVNDQLLIDHWSQTGNATWTNTMELTAGARYNLRMEYANFSGNGRAHLYWTSPSQPRQIIPAPRLYPSSGGLDPGGITSPLNAMAFIRRAFTYTITGANTPLSYGATNLPAGLSINTATGVISGTPSVAGVFGITVSYTNVIGVSTGLLTLRVIDTGSSLTREVWKKAKGSDVSDIPLQLPPDLVEPLTALEGIPNFGDNYGERIRGYITIPTTGNYYFWIAASDSAELWISNDDEPVNRIRRAYVTKNTKPREWDKQTTQRSAWLALKGGQRYYVEILHKAGGGSKDHWSVGWLLDSASTGVAPGEIVPGFVLSPYSEPPASSFAGTLYAANLLPQIGAVSSGGGSGTLRVSPDGSTAILKYSHSGLSTPVTAKHIHADTYQAKNLQGQIIFDIDAATPEADGSYVWHIGPSGPLTAADIVALIKEGKSYLNVHTVNYPAGEISGHLNYADGSMTFTPPPDPPKWKDERSNSNAVARFLQQATFGATPTDFKTVKAGGYEAWLKKQFKQKPSSHLAKVLARARNDEYPGTLTFNTWWEQSVTAPDQLRQRVAFALSEILVVSEQGPLADNARALSSYYDILLENAFGNFRDLLEDVTLSPAMGLYLDMRRNDKGNPSLGTHPNENYAREIMQLFSIGLNRLWPDGSLVLNSKGEPVPTYDQDTIIGYSRVFTGWNYYQEGQADGSQTNKAGKKIKKKGNVRLPIDWNPEPNYIKPMVLVPIHHELGTKGILDNIVLPAAQGNEADFASPEYDEYGLRDLDLALDSIFNNPNVGPFVCRQLIQRMVTSHPSRDYLYRVVQKFNDNGKGVRGDMQAVISAILLDHEARGVLTNATTFGKLREPVLRATSIARAFMAPKELHGSYRQKGSPLITITTGKPHRLSSSDDVYLSFKGSKAPVSRVYNNVAVTNDKSFTIVASGLATATYLQLDDVITITNSNHGLAPGYQLYLTFTSGGADSGLYTVTSVPTNYLFTVAAKDKKPHEGTCLYPRWAPSSLDHGESNTTATVTTPGPHGISAGKTVFIAFPNGSVFSNGVYRIGKTKAPDQFTIPTTVIEDRPEDDLVVLPLSPAPIVRGGSVTVRYSTWEMNYTDGGFNTSLAQTPLNSPTVFNFFLPDFKFPGALATAGLTTPEFQLTSDTSIVLQMNFFASGVFNNGSNTNGLSSFSGGNGAIMLDLGPWMTPEYTSDAGIPRLVDALSSLLCGTPLSAGAKQVIVNYTANPRFAYTLPTNPQMRDRVRAVVHLLVSSPEFNIQR